MLRLLMLYAIIGVCLSTVVHFATFAGFDPLATSPLVWLLHIGIFVVWIPVVLLADRAYIESGLWRFKRGNMEAAIRSAPKWMRRLTWLFGYYAVVNFVIFFLTMMLVFGRGEPRLQNGQYVITSKRGAVIRQSSEREYHHFNAVLLRGFSGHWMLFYMAAITVLYSSIREQRASSFQRQF